MKALSLQIGAVLVALVFGAPITFFPLRWARAFGWRLPADTALTVYFARCLGALIWVLAGLAMYASIHHVHETVMLAGAAAAMLLLSLVHAIGAVQKIQPPLETAETFVYLAAGLYFAWVAHT